MNKKIELIYRFILLKKIFYIKKYKNIGSYVMPRPGTVEIGGKKGTQKGIKVFGEVVFIKKTQPWAKRSWTFSKMPPLGVDPTSASPSQRLAQAALATAASKLLLGARFTGADLVVYYNKSKGKKVEIQKPVALLGCVLSAADFYARDMNIEGNACKKAAEAIFEMIEYDETKNKPTKAKLEEVISKCAGIYKTIAAKYRRGFERREEILKERHKEAANFVNKWAKEVEKVSIPKTPTKTKIAIDSNFDDLFF